MENRRGVFIANDVFDRIIARAIELGNKTQAIEEGRMCCFLTFTDASALYGRGNIERWLDQGFIKRYIDHGALPTTPPRYAVNELIECSLRNNLHRELLYEQKEANKKPVIINGKPW